VPVDAAVVPAPGLCPLAPPLGPGCPPTLPRAVGTCTPSSEQCIYSVTGEVGPMLAIFECTLLQENLIGWKEWDVPCARACLGDAGGLPLDAGMCALRETVPCVPPAGEGVQATLNDQIFATGCQHRDGAGGYTVRFDAQGCATQIAGGLFSDCDVAALSSKRFACAQSHPCATAVTLVK
jgi:hypothetical protein